jgi:hypothetical protein
MYRLLSTARRNKPFLAMVYETSQCYLILCYLEHKGTVVALTVACLIVVV